MGERRPSGLRSIGLGLASGEVDLATFAEQISGAPVHEVPAAPRAEIGCHSGTLALLSALDHTVSAGGTGVLVELAGPVAGQAPAIETQCDTGLTSQIGTVARFTAVAPPITAKPTGTAEQNQQLTARIGGYAEQRPDSAHAIGGVAHVDPTT